MKGGNWKTISSERHFADRNLEVVTDRVQTPARPERGLGRSCIANRRSSSHNHARWKIILIRQERIPIGQAIWEMPSGQIDDHHGGEDKIKDTALREVREETGYELAQTASLFR